MQNLKKYFRIAFISGLWLFAFLIPYNFQYLVPIEALIIVGYLGSQNLKQSFKSIINDRFSIISVSFYFLVIFSILVFPGDKEESIRQALLKLPFLLMPFFIIGSDLKKNEVLNILLAFAYGCLSSGLIQFLESAWEFKDKRQLSVFSHYDFADFMHITYLGMYQLFASAFFLYKGARAIKMNRRVFYISSSILCALFVFLSSAKIMLIALVLIGFIMLILTIRSEKKSVFWYALPLLFLLMPVLLYNFSDKFKIRVDAAATELYLFYTHQDKGRAYSTGQRILLWRNSLDIVKEKPFLGVGVSHVQNMVNYHMEVSGDAYRLPIKLNAHNEYLQTTVGMGVVGLMFLISIYLLPLRYSNKDRMFVTLTFVLILCTASISESIMERQAGVVFLQLVGCLLVAWKLKDHEEFKF